MIKDNFESKGLILNGRIAVAGSSMGGLTTFGCLKAYDWIKVGVSLMGTPNFIDYADRLITEFAKAGVDIPFSNEQIQHLMAALSPFDLSQTPEKLGQRPLLFWHGVKDSVVPFDQDYQFYTSLKENGNENIHFIKDPNAGHKVSREGLFAFADWLKKYL